MRVFGCFFFVFCFLLQTQAQFRKWNITQYGLFNPGLPALGGGQKFNDVWGWYDSVKNKEYAIVGSIDSIYFIEILASGQPVVRDVQKGRGWSTIWRDLETYRHYCYAAQDGVSGSLQIFDMSYLPDSVRVVYDSDSIINRCHTLFRDEDKLFCNTARWKSGLSASLVLSLQDPEKPSVTGVIIPPIVDGSPAFNACHDVFVRNDTLYCSGEVGLFIYDISDISNPKHVGVVKNYQEPGYNHSSWLSDDSRYLFFTDENLGLGIKVLKKPDMSNLDVVKVFRSNNGAVAHNPYVKGNELYVSYYEDGVYVFDIRDAEDPQVMAFFDTYPQNDTTGKYSGFNGCWAVYPFLPSGRLLALDQANGLFVLGVDVHVGLDNPEAGFLVYPNPFTESIHVNSTNVNDEPLLVELFDIAGRKVFERTETPDAAGKIRVIPDVAPGNYILKITGSNVHLCRKMIRL